MKPPVEGKGELERAADGGSAPEARSKSAKGDSAQKWLAENAAAIEAYNERAGKGAILSDFERLF